MSQKNFLKACYNARGLHDAFRAMQGGMEKLNPTFFLNTNILRDTRNIKNYCNY